MTKRDPREMVPITVELFVPDMEASARFYIEDPDGFRLRFASPTV